MSKLKRSFFIGSAIEVARNMLGKNIVHISDGLRLSGKIVETESYIGPEDKAAHSYNWKKTERNKVEYLAGGHIYIYLVYGMYWQLNVTTSREEMPQCVLIRALEPVEGIEEMGRRRKIKSASLLNLTNGPGKLCQAFGFDKSHYGVDVTKSSSVWLEDNGEHIKKSDIVQTERIGIGYAGEWAHKPLRFYLKSSPFVSVR